MLYLNRNYELHEVGIPTKINILKGTHFKPASIEAAIVTTVVEIIDGEDKLESREIERLPSIEHAQDFMIYMGMLLGEGTEVFTYGEYLYWRNTKNRQLQQLRKDWTEGKIV